MARKRLSDAKKGTDPMDTPEAVAANEEPREVEASPEGEFAADSSQSLLFYIPIDMVGPAGDNPRERFDGEDMEGLIASIKADGVLQPLLVRKDLDKPGRFLIIAGERRWRAAKAAGLREVPAVLRESGAGPDDVARLQLVENIQRRDLRPIEEARGMQVLIDKYNYTQGEVAVALGISQPQVANRLRLLKLPDKVQELISREILHAGHGLALLRYLPDGRVYEPFWSQLLKKFLEKPGSVNECEERLHNIARWESKSLMQIGGAHYYAGMDVALFDVAACSGCPANIVFKGSWEKEHNRCINTSCYDVKQATALGELETKRQGGQQVGPGGTAGAEKDDWERQREKEKRKQEERVERIKAKVAKATTEPARAVPDADLPQARRLREFAGAHWEDRDYVFDSECYLRVEDLLAHFQERRDVADRGLPEQFGPGDLHIPAQGITVQNRNYYAGYGQIQLTPLTIIWGDCTVKDTKPIGQAYYRCGVWLSGETIWLEQIAAIATETRDIILASSQPCQIKQNAIPKLAALVAALPAFPGDAEDKRAQEPEAQADMSQPTIPDEDKSFDELPEDDEAFDEEVEPEDADRTCPIDDKPVTDEICSECLQWDDAKGCTYNAGAVPPPAAAPAETSRVVAPEADVVDDGKRRCPLFGHRPVTSEEECRAFPGCDQYDESLDSHCKLIAAERAKRGEKE